MATTSVAVGGADDRGGGALTQPPAGGGGEGAGPRPYPLDIHGELAPNLTRWLWLVKWFLAIPHFIVLIALSIAAFVVTIVAFFAILFTARYPRGLFDFSVGVFRWWWRVAFYCLCPLATDRYPPFSLAPDDDYPADLHVEYPERLSRLKVLFKWWLLAIPHYLVMSFLRGDGGYTIRAGGEQLQSGLKMAQSAIPADIAPIGESLITLGIAGIFGGIFAAVGLMGILVLIALIAKLFSGRYPRDIFDLLIGLNRYQSRVVGYAALLYDDYPPFRLRR